MKQQTSRLLSTTTLSLAVGGLMMLSPTAPCGIGSGQVGVSFGGVAMAACNPCNPCNPCAANNPCNPCAALKKPVNACNPCNPCAAANPCNPCNPCAAANPCNPCNPCAAN